MNIGYFIDRYFIKRPRFRRFVTAALVRDRAESITIAGTKLLANSRREHGYFRAARMTQLNSTLRDEMPVLMNLFALIKDGDTFVDVGANVGLFTHSISRLHNLFPRLKIVAIEPHPDTFLRLAAQPSPWIKYVNAAAGDANGTITFVDGAVSHVFTSMENMTSYNIKSETAVVPTVRLDEIVAGDSPIVMKIDVEGHERKVLDGAIGLFEAGRVRVVYLDGYNDISIHGFLTDRGFKLLNGRTLESINRKVFSLLAIKEH